MTDIQPNQTLIDSVAALLWDHMTRDSLADNLRYAGRGTVTREGLAARILQVVDEAYPERAAASELLAALEDCLKELGHTNSAKWGVAYEKGVTAIALARPSTP